MIHPTADVSDLATIGRGTHIWHQCQVREHANIGENCILGKGVYVDFGVSIGDNVKIQNGAFIYHGTVIESGVFVGPAVVFTNDKLPRAINADGTLKDDTDWQVGPIRICYGASIGAGVVVLPDVEIGRFALVGAGAVVTRSFPNHALVVGNPGRQIGYVCQCATRLKQLSGTNYCCPDCGKEYRF